MTEQWLGYTHAVQYPVVGYALETGGRPADADADVAAGGWPTSWNFQGRCVLLLSQNCTLGTPAACALSAGAGVSLNWSLGPLRCLRNSDFDPWVTIDTQAGQPELAAMPYYTFSSTLTFSQFRWQFLASSAADPSTDRHVVVREARLMESGALPSNFCVLVCKPSRPPPSSGRSRPARTRSPSMPPASLTRVLEGGAHLGGSAGSCSS